MVRYRIGECVALLLALHPCHFLASKALLQVAEDHKSEFAEAAQVVQQSFYMDDCLTRANSLPEAK